MKIVIFFTQNLWTISPSKYYPMATIAQAQFQPLSPNSASIGLILWPVERVQNEENFLFLSFKYFASSPKTKDFFKTLAPCKIPQIFFEIVFYSLQIENTLQQLFQLENVAWPLKMFIPSPAPNENFCKNIFSLNILNHLQKQQTSFQTLALTLCKNCQIF